MTNFFLVAATAGVVVGLIIGWVMSVAAGTAKPGEEKIGAAVGITGFAILAATTFAAFYIGTLL